MRTRQGANAQHGTHLYAFAVSVRVWSMHRLTYRVPDATSAGRWRRPTEPKQDPNTHKEARGDWQRGSCGQAKRMITYTDTRQYR
jgi:hypothetical protein